MKQIYRKDGGGLPGQTVSSNLPLKASTGLYVTTRPMCVCLSKKSRKERLPTLELEKARHGIRCVGARCAPALSMSK